MSIPFTKMHGLGNDFVVIDGRNPSFAGEALTPEIAIRLCDRRHGIGADQILWIRQPQGKADARMEVLNADGSTAEMCGNGIRAVALYLSKESHKPRYVIETLAGTLTVEMKGLGSVVDMGPPKIAKALESLQLPHQQIEFLEVSMGNPHVVIFTESLDREAAQTLGPIIERQPRFPNRTNVEFVRVQGPSAIQVIVWERGAGLTLACGTGACAAAVAAIQTGRVKSPVDVHLPGGMLKISWAPGQSVMMEGPAEEVFRGEIEI